MKAPMNLLLAVAVVVPVVLLFWPFVRWNDPMSFMLRVIPSVSAQILLCRIGKRKTVKAIPTVLTGAGAAWGTYLYCTSPHWSNATFWGLIADYVSPFIGCAAALLACLMIKGKKETRSGFSG